MDKLTFEVKDEHIKLLRAVYVGWDDCEFGAPAIDCKRPYGNSNVYADMREILGLEARSDEEDYDEEWLRRLHEETQTVLQIVLNTGVMAPGVYRRSASYTADWVHEDGSVEPLPMSSFLSAVTAELARARSKFPGKQHNAHEGYAVLLEEVDELWDEVKRQQSAPDRAANMRKELIQIAAMAARMAEDLGL